MNKKILTLGAATLILASTNANAFYYGIGVGTSKAKINGEKLDSKSSYSIYSGMNIPVPFMPIRTELELLQFKSGKTDIGEGKVYGAAANAYLGLPLLPVIKPYIGMGFAFVQEKFGFIKSDWKTVPQYMIGLDLKLPLIPIGGGIEYRYMKATFEDAPYTLDSKIHTIMLKGRLQF